MMVISSVELFTCKENQRTEQCTINNSKPPTKDVCALCQALGCHVYMLPHTTPIANLVCRWYYPIIT